MQQQGVMPNVITYSALISACEKVVLQLQVWGFPHLSSAGAPLPDQFYQCQ